MKRVSIVLATMAIAFSSASFADIQVTSTQNGAWVKVTDNGQPAANAMVTIENLPQVRKSFQTDENGRVYIPLSLNKSSSLKFKAVTEEGNVHSRFAFHGDRRR